MPWGDGTGPWWMGRRGYAAYNPRCLCRGLSARGGFWRYRDWWAPFRETSPAEEMGYLEEMAARLEQELKAIRAQIEKLRTSQ